MGVLLIHGLSGTPEEMRPLGAHLNARGFTVHGVLVAGHSGSMESLRESTWLDWYQSAEAGLDLLLRRCEHVVLVGFSMGAMLATRLAVHRGSIAGLVSMAPALWLRVPAIDLAGVLRHVVHDVPRLSRSPSLRVQRFPTATVHELSRLQKLVRGNLCEVTSPLLVFQGRRDRLVSPRGASAQLHAAQSAAKELVWLERSGHTLPTDVDQMALFERTAAFVARVTRAPS